jgi:hypothetical protein
MKRSILSVVVVVAICAVAIGFYRGWFVLSSSNSGTESKKVNVNLTVDGDKIQDDARAVRKKTGG